VYIVYYMMYRKLALGCEQIVGMFAIQYKSQIGLGVDSNDNEK